MKDGFSAPPPFDDRKRSTDETNPPNCRVVDLFADDDLIVGAAALDGAGHALSKDVDNVLQAIGRLPVGPHVCAGGGPRIYA